MVIQDANERIRKNAELKDEEIIKLLEEKKVLEVTVKSSDKKYHDLTYVSKALKIKEKEIYNLNVKFDKSQGSNDNLKYELSNIKALKSTLEYDVKKLKQKMKKMWPLRKQ